MLSASAVLPIDGRAASTIRSPGLQAGGHAVEVVEAGAHAGDVFGAVLGQLVARGRSAATTSWSMLWKPCLHARAFFADVEDLAARPRRGSARPRLPCGLKAVVAISSLAATSLRRIERSRTISA